MYIRRNYAMEQDLLLMNNVIKATIIVGKFKDENLLIPKIPMVSTNFLFQYKCVQFHLWYSQGQSLKVCGINLEFLWFSHGQ